MSSVKNDGIRCCDLCVLYISSMSYWALPHMILLSSVFLLRYQGVDYDYGSKLVGMVALVAGLMLCPLLHLLRLRSKVLRQRSETWFWALDTRGRGSLSKQVVKDFLTKKLKLKKGDVENLIGQAGTSDDGISEDVIALQEFEEILNEARGHRTQDIRALVVRDVMLVILLFHPFVSGLAMRAWKCTPIASSNPDEPIRSFLSTDMTIECFTSSNWIGIAVFSGFTIILFSLGAPASLFFILARRRDKLGEPLTFKHLGILYSVWRPKYYFFESVEMCFKLLLCTLRLRHHLLRIPNMHLFHINPRSLPHRHTMRCVHHTRWKCLPPLTLSLTRLLVHSFHSLAHPIHSTRSPATPSSLTRSARRGRRRCFERRADSKRGGGKPAVGLRGGAGGGAAVHQGLEGPSGGRRSRLHAHPEAP